MTSDLAARLRDMMRTGGPQHAHDADDSLLEAETVSSALDRRDAGAATPGESGKCLANAAAGVLGGAVVDTPAGPCVVVERVYMQDHRHGALRIGDCACHVHGHAPGLPMLAGSSGPSIANTSHIANPDIPADGAEASPDAARILFLDLETTGLTGGAGTYAFLIGCGWFDGEALHVRQYFMVGHALEPALLAAVRGRLDTCGTLVTYNGKTFDVPVLETRFLFNRQPAPFSECAHVDMLHAARRLWRGARPLVSIPGGQSESCTLAALERSLFGVQRTRDVPGFEIPSRYFAFLRSGDARPLDPVLEHNRLDIVSLAALTARAWQLLGERHPTSDQPRECLGLGRLFERSAMWDRAEACYRRALNLSCGSWHPEDEDVRLGALHGLALRCRRTGRYLEAAKCWEAITRARRCPSGLMREALEALAIHHEHRSRDLVKARTFAEQSRRVVGAQPAIEQRLARLERKIVQRSVVPPLPRTATLWP
jgi:uncharacterized protein YprB with RNaseH-like and TPR domain